MDADQLIKVVHVASGDLWGGAEAQVFTLCKYLHRMPNVGVSVVLLNEGELHRRLCNAGISCYVCDETTQGSLNILKRMVDVFRQVKPNIIHTHRQKENTLASIANLLSARAKSVRTQHGAPEFEYSWRQIDKKLQHYADMCCGKFLQQRVIAVSSDLARQLRPIFGSSHVTVIENGVDLEELDQECSVSDFKISAPDALHVGVVGRLVPVKRVDIFLAIAKASLESELKTQCVFHVIGDGPLRETLEAQVAQLGLGLDRLKFHGHIQNISRYIKSLDILLMCSDHEGLPMTALEAMALGTPIVSRNIGALSESLMRQEGGIYAASHSAEAYLEAVIHLLSDNPLYQSCVTSGRALIEKKLNANENARKMLALYQELYSDE